MVERGPGEPGVVEPVRIPDVHVGIDEGHLRLHPLSVDIAETHHVPYGEERAAAARRSFRVVDHDDRNDGRQ